MLLPVSLSILDDVANSEPNPMTIVDDELCSLDFAMRIVLTVSRINIDP
jgi:hypothetical protein